jgi:hypothetical protein
MACVKRLQIMIEEELDAELALQAAREGVSKAALIRRYVRQCLAPATGVRRGSIWDIVGTLQGGRPDDSARIDEVVYGDLGGS